MTMNIFDNLKADMRSIKDAANEAGAGNPPEGYSELEDTKIADACYQQGMDCMETAILNWIHDQESSAPTRPSEAERAERAARECVRDMAGEEREADVAAFKAIILRTCYGEEANSK